MRRLTSEHSGLRSTGVADSKPSVPVAIRVFVGDRSYRVTLRASGLPAYLRFAISTSLLTVMIGSPGCEMRPATATPGRASSPRGATTEMSPSEIVVTGAPVELGEVVEGDNAFATVTLYNRRAEPQSFGAVATSCDCLHVAIPKCLPSLEYAEVPVRLDSEPGFVGGLCIEVTLRDSQGVALSMFEVRATVVAAKGQSPPFTPRAKSDLSTRAEAER